MAEIQLRSISASAPAKVILHGEHSVVYGKFALAASIDLRTKVTLKLAKKTSKVLKVNLLNYSHSLQFGLESLHGLNYDLKLSETEIDENLKNSLLQMVLDNCPEQHLNHSEGLVALLYLCSAFFKEAGLDLMPLDITVTSDIPMGAGLGSSAAFSVALAGALCHLQNSLKRISCLGEDLNKDLICKWAFKSEKIIHGNPSGAKKFS